MPRYFLTKRSVALAGGAILLFGVGTSVQAGWVLAVAALLLGMLAAGLIVPVRGLRGIEIERTVPRAVTAGDRIAVTLGVTNASRSARALVRLDDRFCGHGAAVVGLLLPGQTREYVGVRDGARRGVYEEGDCELVTGVPFGVARSRRTDAIASPIVVYPRTYEVPRRRLAGAGGVSVPAALGDVSSVREYRPGDPLRHIHWRSVARRGRLVVRDFDTERSVQVAVVADVPDDPDVADAIASIACSLALSALEDGDVDLVATAAVRARSSDAVLNWGARLVPSGRPLTEALLSVRNVPAAICVMASSEDSAAQLREMASATSMLAVFVRAAGEPKDRSAEIVRSAGAQAVSLQFSEVEAWFANGCAVV